MISVIIPLYNKEPIIERTLKSVLSQDYDDFEIIIVDDGSTDNSLKIVQEFKKVQGVQGGKIRIIHQENGGPSKARNTGVKNAMGEWILFLDADDEMTKGSLSHLVNIIDCHHDVNLIVGGASYKSLKGNKLVANYRDGYCYRIFKSIFENKLKPCTGSVIYKKELCQKYEFNEQIRRFEDYECFFRKAHGAILYKTSKQILLINGDFNEASYGRKNINEDFVGHLNFKGKTFWEKMCLYKLFIEEREHYTETRRIYKNLYYRFDLFFLYKLISLICK